MGGWPSTRTLRPRRGTTNVAPVSAWLADRWGDYFEGGMGADAIKQLIDRIDLDEEEVKLRIALDPPSYPASTT